MNKQFEKLMYESGLLADGCWGDMDSYDQDAITKFAELIVRECADFCVHSNSLLLAIRMKEHFGVEK